MADEETINVTGVAPATPGAPVLPDIEFAKRYRLSSRYGFYMRYEDRGESIDDIAGSSRWVVLDLNPQQITVREPYATAIQFTQGGGKVRESRGGLIKLVSISGTTGYLPKPQVKSFVGSKQVSTDPTRRHELVPANDPDLDDKLARISGFYAFHELRYLFRLYAHELKSGNTTVTLNYLDTKHDEYWRIEPTEFVMQRSSRKPFSYDYSISFQILEPSTTQLKLGESVFGTTTSTTFLQVDPAVGRSLDRLSELSGGSALSLANRTFGFVERGVQQLLRSIDDVVGFFSSVSDATKLPAASALTVLAQLESSVDGAWSTISTLQAISTTPADDQIAREYNELALETQALGDFLRIHFTALFANGGSSDVTRQDKRFATGQAKQGSVTALAQPSPGSVGSSDTDPYFGTSGLSMVTAVDKLAKVKAVRTMVVMRGDTIFSLAQRAFGDAQRFIDLVLINNLKSPYVVSDSADKPDGTVAWGEFVLVPDNTVGNAVTPQQAAPNVVTHTGTVTLTGITTELIDTADVDAGGPGWRIDQWVGYIVEVTTGGTVQRGVIVSNTDTKLTVASPWPISLAIGDTYSISYVLFESTRPRMEQDAAFGTDLLMKFRRAADSSDLTCDVVVSSRNDLSLVRGLDNLIQALNIRLHTEFGRHTFHPTFGVQVPIGHAWNDDLGLLYLYMIKASLQQDPRVVAVKNGRLSLDRDQFSFSADVQPIKVRNTTPVGVTLR